MRLLADENFNGAILRGLMRRIPNLDVVRVQDVGLRHADDPTILAWAADEERILLTHDVATITRYAYGRVNQGLLMPGVVEVMATAAIGRVIDDLELFVHPSLFSVVNLKSMRGESFSSLSLDALSYYC